VVNERVYGITSSDESTLGRMIVYRRWSKGDEVRVYVYNMMMRKSDEGELMLCTFQRCKVNGPSARKFQTRLFVFKGNKVVAKSVILS
jgi:hypothetical protein